MKRHLRAVTFTFLVISGLSPHRADAAPFVHLTLASQPGDFIGQGGTFDILYDPSTSTFFNVSVLGDAPVPSFVRFLLGTVTSGTDNTFAFMDFSTSRLGVTLQPGVYLNAERASFAAPGHPGLDISFQNRGCNTLTGNFTVNSAIFSPDGLTLQQFGASFEQHCEGFAPALFGTIEFSASDAPPVAALPEPSTVVLLGTGGFGIIARLRRRRATRNK